jgi:hypothetical protein
MAQQAFTAPERAALAVGLGVSWDDDLVAGRRMVAHAMHRPRFSRHGRSTMTLCLR